jgi:hypothetical protein
VEMRDCGGFRLCLCVFVIFIYDSIVRGEGRMQATWTIFWWYCDIYL